MDGRIKDILLTGVYLFIGLCGICALLAFNHQ